MPKRIINRGGRPVKYTDKTADQARKLCEMGATDMDLAKFFEVGIATIHRWRVRYPEFVAAMKVGKEMADDRVERSLYGKAVGYSHKVEKVFCYEGQVIKTKTTENLPPDTTACIFWLKNRRRNSWSDHHEVSGQVKLEATLTVEQRQTMIRQMRALPTVELAKIIELKPLSKKDEEAA